MNRKDFLKAAVGVIAAPFVVKEVNSKEILGAPVKIYGSLKGSIPLDSDLEKFAPGAFDMESFRVRHLFDHDATITLPCGSDLEKVVHENVIHRLQQMQEPKVIIEP